MASIEELYNSYHNELVLWGQGMTGNRDTAHELVQEGFVRALDSEVLVTSLRESQARAWLYRTIRNLYIDRLRHTKREQIMETLPDELIPVQTVQEYAETEIAEMLQSLPALDRKLFVLRYLEGYNASQLSEIYHIPPGTVRAKLSGARKLLRKALAG